MREKKQKEMPIMNKTMEEMSTKKAELLKFDKCNYSNNISRQLKTLIFYAVLFTLHIQTCASGHDEIPSQMSPKSISAVDLRDEAPMLKTYLSLESTMDDAVVAINVDNGIDSPSSPLDHNENETRQHVRVERSASPIVHENFPKSGPNAVHEDDPKEAVAGRYFQYDIKPTNTLDGKILLDEPEQTLGIRTGKHLDKGNLNAETTTSREQSFLLKGDSRQNLLGSRINPTNNTAMLVTPRATASPHNARQNGNPDIQDIITGIVKLLNGNVNVHANTQGLRRPTASRINNRGPPRISDVQNLPLDYEVQKPPYGTSNRPPPYPFDRPERPFITGVPIPEQIVPLRPGFVSNRPPWHRNKPRPPITTTMGVRRPVPQYKPIPSTQMNPPEQDELPAPPTLLSEDEAANADNMESSGKIDAAPPTSGTNYDTEFSGEDNNEQYIEVTDHDSEVMDEVQEKKDTKKKATGGNKPKNNEKRKTTDPTTIIATSSVVNTVIDISSTYLPMPMDNDDELDPSSEEVIFMTQSRTPILESTVNHEEEKLATTPYLISITTSPLDGVLDSNPTNRPMLPTPNTNIPVPQVLTTAINAMTTDKAITNNIDIPTTTPEPLKTANSPPPTTSQPLTPTATTPSNPLLPPPNYQPRPGIVLDDPEFKPGGRPRHPQRPIQSQIPPAKIQPTRQQLPPGYGEIFDVTLSAIQGPGSIEGSQQTINIKPYGAYESNAGNSNADIIVSASGDDGFVSIDGKRTYINLFGEPTDTPTGVQMPGTTPATTIPQLSGGESAGVALKKDSGIGSVSVAQPPSPPLPGYGIPETEIVELEQNKHQSVRPQAKNPITHAAPTRPLYRQRTTQPPVRIDTCIVGDDSTCDQAQHERCKTENGVSSCHCRPGYSRRKHREPCRKVISFYLGLRVDRIYEHRIVWDNKLLDRHSEPYGQLSYEAVRAIDSAMSMTPYSDEFMDAKVNNIYRGDPKLGGSGVFVNMTLKLDESVETLRPNLRSDVQKHLLGVLHRRNNNIGNSVLYVTSPEGAISALHDLDECQSRELNDCHPSATCSNSWGAFRCSCDAGFRDPWADQPQRAGRDCQTCPDTHCNNRGACSYNDAGQQVCNCESSYYGGQCEIDGEVLGVAIGASVAAVIIIVLTLVCLIMWSRRWQREQKNAIGSPVFGYMNTAPLKSAGMVQPAYQVTLEDRMRWAQIADVMAQSNHYGAEPIGPTRPSSAMFGYPNLQAMGLGTLGGLATLQSHIPMHQSSAPPVPLPRRLGLSSRSNGMRTLENSSSSEEEDRTDLLGRNFQVPRPKSRSNGSIANQSGIYYDVDYEPSGNGIGNTSVDHLYGSQTHSHGGHASGIPMSTYTSGRAPSNSYYMK